MRVRHSRRRRRITRTCFWLPLFRCQGAPCLPAHAVGSRGSLRMTVEVPEGCSVVAPPGRKPGAGAEDARYRCGPAECQPRLRPVGRGRLGRRRIYPTRTSQQTCLDTPHIQNLQAVVHRHGDPHPGPDGRRSVHRSPSSSICDRPDRRHEDRRRRGSKPRPKACPAPGTGPDGTRSRRRRRARKPRAVGVRASRISSTPSRARAARTRTAWPAAPTAFTQKWMP